MSVSGTVSYNKKGGKIILREHNIEWTEAGSMQPSVSIALSAIKNLQSSTGSAASAAMRVFAAPSIGAEPVAHTFKFTLQTGAREEMSSFVKALQAAIAEKTAAQQKTTTHRSVSEILASQHVESDVDLQEALLKSDPELSNTFRLAVINGYVTPAQFWSSRTQLLQQFLAEKSQQKGSYNVLSTIRPKTVDNKITVNMTREKIRDIFAQYPLLRRIYNESVPPLGEDEFWSRFFVSRLCKKLRGERILPSDPVDDKLDQYINIEADENRKRAREEDDADHYIPKVIDLEGNEEHNSTRMGNAPDFTMRPSRTAVINSINNISMGILASSSNRESKDQATETNHAAEQDSYRPENQVGDLQTEQRNPRILLTIRDRQEIANASTESVNPSAATDLERIQSYKTDAIPVQFSLAVELESSEEIDSTSSKLRREVETQALHSSQTTPKELFSPTVHNQVMNCHFASQEFLALCWTHFLSGDPSKAKELSKMVDTLKKTGERIDAIAAKAELESDLVRQVMKPTLKAVDRLIDEYDKATLVANVR